MTIFRYPGGKSRRAVREWILSNRPERVQEYREPFVGGGGIFWSLPAGSRRWVNDLHEGLIEVYRALRDRPEQFIRECRKISPAKPSDELSEPGPRGGMRHNARLKAKFDELAFDDWCDQALRYFFVNRTVHAGRVNYDIPSRVYFSNAPGWNIVSSNRLEEAAVLMQGVRITCRDYTSLFREPGESVWIYADPPYLVNNKLSKSSRLYQHGFSLEDHEKFASEVRKCKHNVAVSYDDHEIVRDLFQGLRFVERGWKYSGSMQQVKKTGKELLILNY